MRAKLTSEEGKKQWVKKKVMTRKLEKKSVSLSSEQASSRSNLRNVDIKDPKYLVPFETGWKREVVQRLIVGNPPASGRRLYDIYYYTPENQRLRTRKEIEAYCKFAV